MAQLFHFNSREDINVLPPLQMSPSTIDRASKSLECLALGLQAARLAGLLGRPR